MIVRSKTAWLRWPRPAGVLAAVLVVHAPIALARDKPPLALSQPTQGSAFVLATTGIDYSWPAVAARLARDGEGEAIAWDAVDGDRLPYAADDEQSRLIMLAPGHVIPIRLIPELAASSTSAVNFARRTPARVIVVPWRLVETPSSSEFVAALAGAKDFLVLIAAGDGDGDVRRVHPGITANAHFLTVGALPPGDAPDAPVQKGGVDLILVPPAASREAPGKPSATPRNSSEAAILTVGLLTCHKAKFETAKTPAEAKKLLLSLAQIDGRTGMPFIEDCTRGGTTLR